MEREVQDTLRSIGDNVEGIGDRIKVVETSVNDNHRAIEEKLTGVDERLTSVEDTTRSRLEVEIPGLADEKREFSFAQALKGICFGDWGDGFEKSIFKEARAVNTGTDSAGGYFVPATYMDEIIELVRANSVVDALGTRRIGAQGGMPLEIPKQTGGATAYWVGESTDITQSTMTAGMLTLRPKKCAAYTRVSNRFLYNATSQAEGLIREDIARVVALAADKAFFEGSGSSFEPQGIDGLDIGATGVYGVETDVNFFNAVAAPGANLNTLDEMFSALQVSNTARGNMSYVMHPAVMKKIRQERTAQTGAGTGQLGNYVFRAKSDESIRDAIGFDWHTTTQLAADAAVPGAGAIAGQYAIYFANWEDSIWAQWRGMELLASNVASDGTASAFTSDQTWIRAITEMDFGHRHNSSIAKVVTTIV
jgi:HK97 family phage major capsid protein